EVKCCEEIAGQARGEPGKTVRCSGRYKEQIDGLGDKDVVECTFKVTPGMRTFEQIDIDFVARQRAERQRRDELRGALRHEDDDIHAAVLQTTEHLRCLVAGNSAADAETYFHSSGSATTMG